MRFSTHLMCLWKVISGFQFESQSKASVHDEGSRGASRGLKSIANFSGSRQACHAEYICSPRWPLPAQTHCIGAGM